jgi:hypothetical protein
LSEEEETDLSSASVPSRGITIDENPSFGNEIHIHNDYIRTIYFLVQGIFVEILILLRRDKDHADQPAGISWLWFWVPTEIFFVP